MHTFVSGILVVPFVGTLDRAPAFTLNEGEIDEVLVFGIERLASAERTVSYDRPDGRDLARVRVRARGHTVWGATGWMLHTLLETIREETTWPMP